MPIANVITALVTAGVYAHGGWRKKRLINKEEVKVTEEILKDEGMR